MKKKVLPLLQVLRLKQRFNNVDHGSSRRNISEMLKCIDLITHSMILQHSTFLRKNGRASVLLSLSTGSSKAKTMTRFCSSKKANSMKLYIMMLSYAKDYWTYSGWEVTIL